MQSLRSDIKSGAFVLGALAIGIVLVFSVGQTPLGSQGATQSYTVLLTNAAGIKPGAAVTYMGTRVGNVEDIILPMADADDGFGPVGRHVDVVIAIRAELELEIDCKVSVQASALGDSHLDITPGSRSEFHAAGASIAGTTPPSFSEVMESARDLFADAGGSIESVNRILGDVEETGSVAPTLSNFKKLTDSLIVTVKYINGVVGENRGVINGLLVKLDDAVFNADRLMTEARELIEQNKPRVSSLLTELDATSQELKGLLTSSRPLVQRTLSSVDSLAVALPGQIDGLVSSADTTADEITRLTQDISTLMRNLDQLVTKNDATIYLALRELEEALRAAKGFARQLEASPSSLVWGGDGVPEESEDARRRRELGALLELGKLPPEGQP